LATKLAAQDPLPPTSESPDVTPIPDAESDSAAIVGDRYATNPSAAETPNATTPPGATPIDELFADPPAADSTPSEPSSPESTSNADLPATEPTDSPSPLADDSFSSFFDEPLEKEDATAAQDEEMTAEEREAKAEISDVPLASPPDDPIPASQNTRLATWLLGSKLSLAALANEHGAPVEQVEKLLDQSKTLAKMLGVSVPELPARPASNAARPATDPALDFLFTRGQEIGRELTQKQNADQAALFEVAVKSNLLLVLYKPGTPTTEAIATAIEQAGSRAKLPQELWQPLLDVLASRPSQADVQRAVFKLHADVDKYLTL
jgi:hypothetical protein